MYVHTSTTSVPVHVLLYVCTYVHTYTHTQLGDNCHLYQAARNCSRNFLWSNNKAARVPDNGRYVQPVWCTFPFTPLCCITVISTINDSCILRKSSRVSNQRHEVHPPINWLLLRLTCFRSLEVWMVYLTEFAFPWSHICLRWAVCNWPPGSQARWIIPTRPGKALVRSVWNNVARVVIYGYVTICCIHNSTKVSGLLKYNLLFKIHSYHIHTLYHRICSDYLYICS